MKSYFYDDDASFFTLLQDKVKSIKDFKQKIQMHYVFLSAVNDLLVKLFNHGEGIVS